MSTPTVSIITPIYNVERYIDEAVKSVLNQSFKDFELLLIDDCSTDSTKKLAEEFAAKDARVKVLFTPVNSWAHAAGNVGLEHAKGKYVYIMDGDDKIIDGTLEYQVKFMEENPDIDVCGGWFQCFEATDKLMATYETDDLRIRMGMLYDSTLGHGGTIIKRDVIEKNKIRYNTDIFYTHDYHFFTQLAFDGKATFTSLKRPVYLYRIHKGQTSMALSDKQVVSSDRVRTEVLGRLGITDEQIIKAHIELCHKTPQKIENPSKVIPAYYNALVKANTKTDFFPAKEFNTYIALKIMRNLNRLGIKGISVFLSLPQEFKNTTSFKDKLKFIFKCMRPAKKHSK